MSQLYRFDGQVRNPQMAIKDEEVMAASPAQAWLILRKRVCKKAKVVRVFFVEGDIKITPLAEEHRKEQRDQAEERSPRQQQLF